MKLWWLGTWLFLMVLHLCTEHARSLLVEDQDGSGDDAEGSGSGDSWAGYTDLNAVHTSLSPLTPVEDNIVPAVNLGDTRMEKPDDSDIIFDSQPVTGHMPPPSNQGSHGFLEDKETLAAVISGGVGALLLAIVAVAALVYFMKRREQAKYRGDQTPAHNNTVYHKTATKDEFIKV